MDIFNGPYYKLNYILLAMIGQWPYQKRSTMIILRSLVTALLFSGIAVTVLKCIMDDNDMDAIVEIAVFIVLLIIIWLKYLSYWIYNDKLMLLIEEMKHDWKTQKSKEELRILEDTAAETRLYNLRCIWRNRYALLLLPAYLAVISCIGTIATVTPSFLNIVMPLDEPRRREFVFQANYMVDSQKYYYPIVLHMLICMSVGVLVIVATDTMYATYVHHACGMFSITGYYLEHMFDSIVETSMEKEMYLRIACGVEYHRKAIRFANMVNSLYEWVMFVTLLLVMCNMSLTLYYIIVDATGLFEAVRAVVNIIAQMSQVFFDVYPGQKLIDRSEIIFQKVYNSQWYVTSIGAQKLLLIIMRASMNPSQIIPGKILVFSSETYSSVIQTAVSYFTVLHSVR